jgi:hypothetical protein
MNLNTRFVPLFAKIRQFEFGRKISGKMRALGLGGIIGTTVFGYPFSQGMAYGFDQWGRSWNQQSYHIWNFFSDVKPDVVILYSCDWATAGNIVTLQNQENAGDTNARIEAGMHVFSVTFDGKIHEIPPENEAVIIMSQYGMLTMYRSGFYVYISEQKQVEGHQSEEFSVALRGENNVKETASLRIEAYKVTKTANKMADYGNQTLGPNHFDQGKEAYQTTLQTGAMIFGWEASDILKGSTSSDVIFGWQNDDALYGLDGDDFISGEQGSNHLYGGKGADVFDFHSGKANNATFDIIYDFNLAEGDLLSFTSVIEADAWDQHVEADPSIRWATKFFKFAIEQNHLDILVNTSGSEGAKYFPIVRLMNSPGFNASEASLIDFLKRGVINPA